MRAEFLHNESQTDSLVEADSQFR